MADTTRITVTLPSEQVTELRKLTDNVSGFVAEAVARQLRHQLIGGDPLPDLEERNELDPAPDTIKKRLEALRSLGGGASHDDVLAETRKICES